tara:strand:+ start:1238 stop:1534 length:297 start_codon:yes stop_codon:yes gene_type:complete
MNQSSQIQNKLKWTGKKNELVELIYAIYSSKKINHGNIEIQEITNVFEEVFKIKLGNYYQKFHSIRCRQKNRTKFLDTIKENAIEYMDKLDGINTENM